MFFSEEPQRIDWRQVITGQQSPTVKVNASIDKETAATLYKTAGIFAAGFILGAVINNLRG